MIDVLRKMARTAAESGPAARARELWARNRSDWNLPLTKMEKGMIAGYLVLSEFADGRFPPRFGDMGDVHDNEVRYGTDLPGITAAAYADVELHKPFWSNTAARYLRSFALLCDVFQNLGVTPPMRVLEIGAGNGWMSEFLATMGFDVTVTTIAPKDIELAQKRMDGLRARGLSPSMRLVACPMEAVHEALGGQSNFDCAFVHEALHHAADWRMALRSSVACLKTGGWIVVANEPNRAHTVVSLRVGLLARTHEIGMSRSAIRRCLQENGCSAIRMLRNRFDFWLLPIWLAGQKDPRGTAGLT